jgi:hypothetical protein
LVLFFFLFRNFGLVCENKSNRTVRLSSNFQGSKNVLSSRHAFQMIDTIPAKTQQLIAIFTRKMFSNDVQIGKLRSFDSPIYLILVFVFSLLAYQVG